MGWIFSKKEDTDKKIGRVHSMLNDSFYKLRYDMHMIFQWMQHFHKKNSEMDERLRRLENMAHNPHNMDDISMIVDRKAFEHEKRIMELERKAHEPKDMSHEEIRKVVDRYYNQEELLERLERLQRRLIDIENRHIMPEKVEELHNRINALESKKEEVKKNLRDKIVAKITKNSKDYIKNLIISLIKKYESITGLQLKEIVVEEQGLCSKSSFYRLLTEIEEMEEINMIREGKEKRYFIKVLKSV